MSTLSRRSFLKTSGLVATASALPSLSSSPRVHAGEDNTIKIAWIGNGSRGGGAIRQALNADENTKLYAVADAFEARAKNAVQSVIDTHGEDRVDCEGRIFHDLDGFKQAVDCLDDGDVVVLTTPQGFRPITFEYVANHKKHLNVFMEKPLGVDIPGLKRLMAANEVAKKKGIQVGVGLNNRHYFRTEETVNAIRDGKLGDVLTTWVYRLQGPHILNVHEDFTPLQNEISNIFCFDWTSGGFIVDALIHNIDICCWCMDDYPIAAFASGGRICDAHDKGVRRMQDQLIDCGAIEYVFKDGRRMNLHTRTLPNCWNMFQANVQGAKGCAQVGEGVGDPAIYEGTEMRDGATRKVLWKPESPANDSYQDEHRLLFKAIRNNDPWNEVQYAVDATRTALLGRTAMETGQYITMEQLMTSTKELVPNIDDLRIDSESPTPRDENGNYWIATPGVTKFE
ncbi:MAG: twin-arginine translocation signal domain-containing protein [Planctomycetia bacterium]|nr:twin-arginine translocation signal domain-containing protein [Planctomycetia bacterium]